MKYPGPIRLINEAWLLSVLAISAAVVGAWVLIFAFVWWPASAQQSTPIPIVDVTAGTRCTAVFVPTTAATGVQMDCWTMGKPIMTGAVFSLAAIAGSTSGFSFAFEDGADVMRILIRRANITAPLHIEASVNGENLQVKDVPVP